MSDQIYVATRKGLFTVERSGSKWEISRADFIGENATICLHDHRDDSQYVALAHGHFGVKLHRSFDRGKNWEECAVPVYPEFTEDDKQKQAAAGEIGASSFPA